MILCLLLMTFQDASKWREELKAAISKGDSVRAQAAIDGLAGLDNAQAADALSWALGACKKEELGWAARRKEIETRERRAAEECRPFQDRVGHAQADFRQNPSLDNRQRVQSAQRDLQPFAARLNEARKTLAEFDRQAKSWAGIRDAIVAAMARFRSEDGIRGLIERLRTSPDWSVRAGVAVAFESVDREDVLQGLIDQLGREKEPTVKVSILDALRVKNVRTPEVIQAVGEQVKIGDSWQVQFAALQIVRGLKLVELVEAVIEGMAKADGRLVYDFQETLAELTGVDKGIAPGAWKAWWDENKAAVQGGSYRARPEESVGRIGAGRTAFFGIPVKSKRIVFVLDRSGSMMSEVEFEPEPDVPAEVGPPKGKRKIDLARWQVKKVLHQMPEGSTFNIVLYGDSFEMFSDKMVRLDKKSREQAAAFLDRFEPAGATNVFDSMERALKFALGPDGKLAKDGVDTLYLLSDGAPTKGKFVDPEDILREVKSLNADLKVAIHTILLCSEVTRIAGIPVGGTTEKEEDLMRKLAEQNGGQYASIGKPKSRIVAKPF